MALPNDRVATPTSVTPEGIPIFERPLGLNFSLVVEGAPGGSRKPVGKSTFNSDPFDPSVRPDLQMIVSRLLGDGSVEVCDNFDPVGGVPPVTPPDYSLTQAISDAISDLGCRFLDGTGAPSGRGPGEACTVSPDGEFRFVVGSSTIQFCGLFDLPFRFHLGDTLVTVRIRDTGGNLSKPAQLIVRVLGEPSP